MMRKEHLLHRRFQLPKGCTVKSFVIRELDGHDELLASRWADAKTGSADNKTNALMDENLRVAIVEINGKEVIQPYLDMDKWSSKTRRFLLEAWGRLNAAPEDELAAFLATAEDVQVIDPPATEMTLEEVKVLAK